MNWEARYGEAARFSFAATFGAGAIGSHVWRHRLLLVTASRLGIDGFGLLGRARWLAAGLAVLGWLACETAKGMRDGPGVCGVVSVPCMLFGY